jgi:hypothetical protein
MQKIASKYLQRASKQHLSRLFFCRMLHMTRK